MERRHAELIARLDALLAEAPARRPSSFFTLSRGELLDAVEPEAEGPEESAAPSEAAAGADAGDEQTAAPR